ncbi:hypothetical protein NLJ89_g1538 [Agrocybe chaxingu]|uniref:CLASP N-terminal domain-containing protein n=1 Tax=Agrocybe chaxingu TaxID=84603 RepID=A0A9W8MZT3_9AGAR|nr:hypothetical protein NLJ89_g1538 [Agrocybe chaxingu]
MLNLTPADVKHELEKLHYDLFLEETEDNWEKTAKAMNAFNKICMDGGYDVAGPEVVNAFRGAHRPIISAMNSERTRLSGCALDLVNSVATAVGKDFEQLLSIFMPPLLALCGRTNKVVTNRARGVIFNVIEVAQLASVLSYFLRDIKDKSISLRQVIAEGTLAVLNSCNPPDLEKEARAKEIEAIIRGTARDANADVRKVSRKIFESYKILLPSRVESFTAPLSPTMKKYLDIKSNTLTTHKSTSNLRSNLNLNPETKPSASTTASTTTITRPNGHARTASASTFSTGTTSAQAKNLATSLTRVSRKEPTAAPSAPVRQVQPSRVVSQSHHETQRAAPSNVGPSRATASQETKRPIPPLRSQRSIISQSTGSSMAAAPIAPRRLQLNPNPPAANAAPLASSGPRRVPMAPPPPPALKKDEAPKRPASRVDNAASTATTASRTAAPLPAPMKKPASSTTSSLKDRVPSTKPPVPKFKPASSTTSATGAPSASTAENKPTTAKTITKPPVPKYRPTPAAPSGPAAASGTTKPLAMAKAKPLWGSGPSAKPATSQKGASLAKTVVKKASTRTIAKPPVAGAVKNIRRPVTPEMVALPPPTPEEEKVSPDSIQKVKAKEEKVTVEHVEKQNSPAVSPIPESVLVNNVEVSEQFSEKKEEKGTVEAESASTTLTDDRSTATTSTVTAHIQTAFGSYRIGAAPASITTNSNQPPMRLPTSNADLLLPRTPSNNFLLPNASNPAFATKTPISALLSSIEQGFLYSPVTPLSPPDAYMPGPNGTPSSYCHQRDAPRVEGPMQPFNYALHQHGGAVFGGMFGGKKEAELVRGDIGVVSVNMNDQKMFVPVALPGLDERLGFVDFNQ